MDGQSAIRLLDLLSDDKPNARARRTGIKPHATQAGRAPSPYELSLRTALHLLRSSGKMTESIATMLLPKLLERLTWRRAEKTAPPFIPHPLLNADIGNARGFVFGTLPVADLMRIKQRFAVTFNDVVLALISGALRQYLSAREALPEHTLRAGIAISLRAEGDEDLSNKVTNAHVTLATDEDDPVRRIQAIHEASTQAKAAAHGDAKGAMEFVQSLPPLFFKVIVESVNAEQGAHIIGAHLEVSNMRNDGAPRYLAGAKIDSTFPMSVIAAGIALNMTCISSGDTLDIGLTVNPDSLDQPWALVKHLKAELERLKKLARNTTR